MIKIGIIGATGYTGEELLRVLGRHEQAHITFVTSEREQGKPLSKSFPQLPKYINMQFVSAQQSTSMDVDIVFLCLPAGESAKWAIPFLDKGTKVIDLGADFRFYDPVIYKKWYSLDHPYPDLLKSTVYGLPEWNRDKIKNATFVGNPGCYPTSVLLAMLPLIKANVVADETILIDSKSGVSGAGKTPNQTNHYVHANENMLAYKPGRIHRHVGEIEQELSVMSHKESKVIFTPHLTPMTRGIFSSIYVKLKQETSQDQLLSILKKVYEQESFVHVLNDRIPSSNMAAHSNNCFISAAIAADTSYAILFSVIDNLGKGASWQAIQNMNIMMGLSENMGLV